MDWPALITALGGLLLAAGMLAQQLWAIRKDMKKSQQVMQETLEVVAANVETVHKATNSMKDELVREVRKAATLKATADERARAAGEPVPDKPTDRIGEP